MQAAVFPACTTARSGVYITENHVAKKIHNDESETPQSHPKQRAGASPRCRRPPDSQGRRGGYVGLWLHDSPKSGGRGVAAGGRWDRRGVPSPNDPYHPWTAPAPGGTRWSPYMSEMYRIETHTRMCPHTGVLAIPSSRTALTGGGQKQSPGQPDFAKIGHWSIRRNRSFSLVHGDPHPVWELRSHTMALGNASLFRHPNCYVGGQSLCEEGLAS